jgi:hypothetical protein
MEELEVGSFDFWIGEWDCVFEGGHAINTVTRQFDDAVTMERFEMDAPHQWSGMSVSVYNADLNSWRQTWADAGGSYVHFIGGMVDGNPSFGAPEPVDVDPLYRRMVFTDISSGDFNWCWESSPTGSSGPRTGRSPTAGAETACCRNPPASFSPPT